MNEGGQLAALLHTGKKIARKTQDVLTDAKSCETYALGIA
jgi:hypothetical protein